MLPLWFVKGSASAELMFHSFMLVRKYCTKENENGMKENTGLNNHNEALWVMPENALTNI